MKPCHRRSAFGAAHLFVVAALSAAFDAVADDGLAGRTWLDGQLVEKSAGAVTASGQGIDDAGRMTVAYAQATGGRVALFATRGTPPSAGGPAKFSKAAIIDGGLTLADGIAPLVAVAPNGNAAAAWLHDADCTATTYRTTGICHYLYAARYVAKSGQWQAPVLVRDTPAAPTLLLTNNAGDVAVEMTGWVRTGASSYFSKWATAWRGHAQAAFTQALTMDAQFDYAGLGLDAAGNLAVAGHVTGSSGHVGVYRGNVTKGLRSLETLGTPDTGAAVQTLAVGSGGQVVVVWDHLGRFAATASSSKAAWSVTQIAPSGYQASSASVRSVVADDGTAFVYDFGAATVSQGNGGTWQQAHPLPAGFPSDAFNRPAIARNGNVLWVATATLGSYSNSGAWATYDAATDTTVHAVDRSSPDGYVLGVDASSRGVGFSSPLLSVSGIGALTMGNTYARLPSPDDPAGAQAPAANLWATFLR